MIEEHTFLVIDDGEDMNYANSWTRSYHYIIPEEIEIIEPYKANGWSDRLTLFAYDNQYFITKSQNQFVDKLSTIYTVEFMVRYIKESTTRQPINTTDNKEYLQFITNTLRDRSLKTLLSE